MPRQPAPLPALLGDTFHTSTAQREGVSLRRLRAADLDAPFRGVRQLPVPTPVADAAPFAQDRAQRDVVLRRARAYAEVMPPSGFFAGRTALALRALPVRHGSDLEVAVISPARAPRRGGVRGRRVEPHLAHVELVAGLPTATAAVAWAMLAPTLSTRELIVLGDAIVRVPRDRFGVRRPERAVSDLDRLSRAAEAGRRRGVHRLREALELISTRSASPLETEFRLDAAAAGLPTPTLDAEIRDERGRLVGISEFLFGPWDVVVEIEGDHHRTDRAQWRRDLEKYAAYADLGIEVVRLTGADVRSVRGIERVRGVLTRRGWTA